jgi:hypothetical protein
MKPNGLPTHPRVFDQVRSALLAYATGKISLTEAMRVIDNAYTRSGEVKSA